MKEVTEMKITTKIISMILSLVLAATLFGCTAEKSSTQNTTVKASNTSETPSLSGELLEDPEDSSKEATGDFRITGGSVEANGSVYKITSGGEYTLTGLLKDGQIVIEAGEDDEVELLLDNASIGCSDNSPILVVSAGEVHVKSEDATYNVVSDNRTGTVSDDEDAYNAAIYSNCDLHVNGSGTLIVKSTYDNGIKSKDDLEIKNVTLKVIAPGVALKGNDSVSIESGRLMIISTQGDGIKTSNSDVSSKSNQRGTVSIVGGQVDIYAAGDGISAAYNAEISQGEEATAVNVFTGSESSYTSDQPDSTKGIKASNEIIISGGIINVNSADDGLHANANVELDNGSTSLGNITISGGTLTFECEDDAVHADGEVTISDGTVNVKDSHEGIEGNVINISGGTTYVYGEDDALNASKGNSATLINITGGYLEVETPQGDTDAIDSNGSITMSGGFVLVKGGAQMGGMAGSVDADGTVSVTGGTIIALGGVASTPTNGSVATYITSSGTLKAGEYTLKDSSDNEIATFSLDGSYSFGWIASDKMTVGETYTLLRDGSEVLTWTQSSLIEGSAGNMGMGGMGAPGGKMQGGPDGNMQGGPGGNMMGGPGSSQSM